MLGPGECVCSSAQLSLLLLCGLLQLLEPKSQDLTLRLCLLPRGLVDLCLLLEAQAELQKSCLLILQLLVALLKLETVLIKLSDLLLENCPRSIELSLVSRLALGPGMKALLELFCTGVKALSCLLKLGLQDVCPSALLSGDRAGSVKLCGGLPEDAALVIQPPTQSQDVLVWKCRSWTGEPV